MEPIAEQKRSKQQLIEDLEACRQRIAELKASQAVDTGVRETGWKREDQYRALVEASPDMVYIVNRDEKVRYVNPVAAERFAVDAEVIEGAGVERLFPSQIEEGWRDQVRRVLESGDRLELENRVDLANGEMWLSTSLAPMTRDGEVQAVLGISRDISERKKAERALTERVKELTCLYAVHRDMESNLSPEEVCQ